MKHLLFVFLVSSSHLFAIFDGGGSWATAFWSEMNYIENLASKVQDKAHYAQELTEWKKQYEQLTNLLEFQRDLKRIQDDIKRFKGNPLDQRITFRNVRRLLNRIGINPNEDVRNRYSIERSVENTWGNILEPLPTRDGYQQKIDYSTKQSMKKNAYFEEMKQKIDDDNLLINEEIDNLSEDLQNTLSDIDNAKTEAEIAKHTAKLSGIQSQLQILYDKKEDNQKALDQFSKLSENTEDKKYEAGQKKKNQEFKQTWKVIRENEI